MTTRTPPSDSVVYIVDDDPLVRRALTRSFQSRGLQVASFAGAREFLNCEREDVTGCLILDVDMPGQTGIELQEQLVARHVDLPIIFLTAHGDIPMTVTAMKAGAIDFLTKPVDQERLVQTVLEAIERHADQRQQFAELRQFQQRVDSLSVREHQVMTLAVSGMLNKQIAHQLGITERTVKEHRGRVMRKTRVKSIAELARLCERTDMAVHPVRTRDDEMVKKADDRAVD